MKPRLFAFSVFVAFLIPTGYARADIPVPPMAVRSITSHQSQGLGGPIQTITVWPGAGTNINFIPTGKIVKKVWLDDIRLLTIDFDGSMCAPGGGTGEQSCDSSGATVLHFRRINPIEVDMPHTDSTLLTAIVEVPGTSRDRELHQFRVTYGKRTPLYNTVTIYPDLKQTVAVGMGGFLQTQLGNINLGLQVAKSRKLLGRSQGNQRLELRVQNFLALVSTGTTLQSAAQQAGVSMELISKLAALGISATESSVLSDSSQQQSLTSTNSATVGAQPYTTNSSNAAMVSLPRKQLLQLPNFVTSPSAAAPNQNQLPVIAPIPEQLPTATSKPTNVLIQQKVASSNFNSFGGRSRRATAASSSQAPNYSQQAINDANAAAFGLTVARHKGQIDPDTLTWRQAQGAIRQLRLGKSREEAARLANISTSVLSQLIQWGQNRP